MSAEVLVLVVFIDGRFYVANAFNDIAVAKSWASQFDDVDNAEIRGARVPFELLGKFFNI